MVRLPEDFTEEKAKEQNYPCHMCQYGNLCGIYKEWNNWDVKFCTKCTKPKWNTKPSEFKLFKPRNKTAHNNPKTPLIDSTQAI